MSEAASPDVAGRGAMLAARILLGVATFLSVVAIFALWVNRQALDTGEWTSTSVKLLQNAQIRSALSDYLVDQLYANVDVAAQLRSARFRVEVDDRRERMQAKLRDAQAQQVPYMLVVGDRDQQNGTVSVRERREGDQGPRPIAEFLEDLEKRRAARQ